jgi:hypothetical protein
MIIYKDGVSVESFAGFIPEQNITNKANSHLYRIKFDNLFLFNDFNEVKNTIKKQSILY